MQTAIVFLLILTVAIIIHELAHFFNAKSVGVPVRAFSLGMGPVLFRKKWQGTEWRLSLLPLGGYVDLPGLAPETDKDGKLYYPEEGFAKKNFGQKLWILVGGVIANYILAILLLAFITSTDSSYRTITTGITPNTSGTVFSQVDVGSRAETLGIKAGDIVLAINDIENPNLDQVIQEIQHEQGLTLLIERDRKAVTLETTWPPKDIEGTPKLGVALIPLHVAPLASVSYMQALSESVVFTIKVIPETVRSFAKTFVTTFMGQRSEEVAGPVRMVGMVNEATKGGLLPVLLMAALINFSLAVFNLLPIPGLDGGRILFASIIALRGKPLPPGREEFIHLMGIAVLMVFIALITFGEVRDLFGS